MPDFGSEGICRTKDRGQTKWFTHVPFRNVALTFSVNDSHTHSNPIRTGRPDHVSSSQMREEVPVCFYFFIILQGKIYEGTHKQIAYLIYIDNIQYLL